MKQLIFKKDFFVKTLITIGTLLNFMATYITISHAFLENPIHINKAFLLLTFGCLLVANGYRLKKKK